MQWRARKSLGCLDVCCGVSLRDGSLARLIQVVEWDIVRVGQVGQTIGTLVPNSDISSDTPHGLIAFRSTILGAISRTLIAATRVRPSGYVRDEA